MCVDTSIQCSDVVCDGVIAQADFTPLMFCAYHGHPRVAEALIKAGCDINAQGSVRTLYLLYPVQ